MPEHNTEVSERARTTGQLADANFRQMNAPWTNETFERSSRVGSPDTEHLTPSARRTVSHETRSRFVTRETSEAEAHLKGESKRFPLVLGLDTFGDVTHDDQDRPLSHAQTIRNVVELSG